MAPGTPNPMAISVNGADERVDEADRRPQPALPGLVMAVLSHLRPEDAMRDIGHHETVTRVWLNSTPTMTREPGFDINCSGVLPTPEPDTAVSERTTRPDRRRLAVIAEMVARDRPVPAAICARLAVPWTRSRSST